MTTTEVIQALVNEDPNAVPFDPSVGNGYHLSNGNSIYEVQTDNLTILAVAVMNQQAMSVFESIAYHSIDTGFNVLLSGDVNLVNNMDLGSIGYTVGLHLVSEIQDLSNEETGSQTSVVTKNYAPYMLTYNPDQ